MKVTSIQSNNHQLKTLCDLSTQLAIISRSLCLAWEITRNQAITGKEGVKGVLQASIQWKGQQSYSAKAEEELHWQRKVLGRRTSPGKTWRYRQTGVFGKLGGT